MTSDTKIDRRLFMRCMLSGAAGCWAMSMDKAFSASMPASQSQPTSNRTDGSRPNILLIVADDLNWNSVGAFGCPVPETTPNIDRLAAEGVRFEHAHVNIAVCQPCRSVMMTGLYSHRCGGEGFFHLRNKNIPILPDLLRNAGYRVGILGKVTHSTPYVSFRWDMSHDQEELGQGRDPQMYAKYAGEFIEETAKAGKPFFLMANSHDPHRPFYGNDKDEWYQPGKFPPASRPSKAFTPEEVTVPGFLPDLPPVRKEIAEYYSSARRCDDTVGAILRVLENAGRMENTLVIFLSDNGISAPFAKTNCYLHSTKTPLIVRWPGVTKPGAVDAHHLVSAVDFMPTILEAAGIEPPEGMDGVSVRPLLQGEPQLEREHVFTQFHLTVAGKYFPMRCVQSKRFGYIFNPWSNGQREFRNESQSGRTWKAMQQAVDSPNVTARVELFSHRVLEEFYDLANDPDAQKNLIYDPAFANDIDAARKQLENWMSRFEDPALEAFRNREDPKALESFMDKAAREFPQGRSRANEE